MNTYFVSQCLSIWNWTDMKTDLPWSRDHSHMHFTYLIAHCNFLWSRIFGFRDIFQSLNLIGHCHFPESRDIFSCNILHTAYFQAAKNFVKYLVASNLPLGLIVQLSFIWILLIAYLVERTKMHWNHESFTIFSKNSLVVKIRKKLGYQWKSRSWQTWHLWTERSVSAQKDQFMSEYAR